MIKFIVLTRSRTGSNLLVSMLNSHPDVRCGGEELRSLNGRQVSEAIETSFPIRQALKASGFKIFYYHPLDDSSGAVWDTLSAMRELRVLHLMRRNILRTLTLIRQKSGRTRERLFDSVEQAFRGGVTTQSQYGSPTWA